MRINVDYIGGVRHAFHEAIMFTRDRRTKRKLSGREAHELNMLLVKSIRYLTREVEVLRDRVAKLEREHGQISALTTENDVLHAQLDAQIRANHAGDVTPV